MDSAARWIRLLRSCIGALPRLLPSNRCGRSAATRSRMRTRRRSADQFSPRKLSKVSSLALLNAASSDCSIACSVTSPGVVMRLSCSRLNRSTMRWIRPVQSRSSSLEEVCPTLARSWVEPTTPSKPLDTTDFRTEVCTLLGGAPSEASTRSLRELLELELELELDLSEPE